MRDPATFEAAMKLMQSTVCLLREYAFPDELQLHCREQVSSSGIGLSILEGYPPIFVAAQVGEGRYDVQAELPFPSTIRSKGVNKADYTIGLPPNDMVGGAIKIEGPARRIGLIHRTTTTAAVLNGLCSALTELKRGVPILGHRTEFKPINFGDIDIPPQNPQQT